MPMDISGHHIIHFSPEEFTDVHGMYVPLLLTLDKLRTYMGRAIKVHESNPSPAASSSHVPNSRHFVGRAVDCSCTGVPLWAFFLAATRFLEFTGIGVYPYWNSPGLHLEIDDVDMRKYWWRDQVGNYRAINVYDLSEVFTPPSSFDT
jgi:hypothetical protein